MAADGAQPVRLESDCLGQIEVSADRLWGAHTQRALSHFYAGSDLMPAEVVTALAMIKKAAALTNRELGLLDKDKADLITTAADEIIGGGLQEHFPLSVWMSGSGTQANMNLNEVIANRAIALAGGVLGSKSPVHPTDHVNLCQSTNDVFPTAMHLAAARGLQRRLIPSVRSVKSALEQKVAQWADIVKIGRTHLQDALPLTLGQEFSGYAAMLEDNLARMEAELRQLYIVAIGGTAVGTGFGARRGFAEGVCRHLAAMTGMPFQTASNKFAAMGAHDTMVMISALLKILAGSLYKIANDIRLLGSGPRCGLHELELPSHEPGSSMMPGKINPTQCESLAMIAVQVMGYDAAVTFAGAGGHLEMNAYKPLIVFNIMKSIAMLSDGCDRFIHYVLEGLEPDRKMIDYYRGRSLMLVTALIPRIGYDKAAEIARLAHGRGITLKEASNEMGYVSGDEFDRLVDPNGMVNQRDS